MAYPRIPADADVDREVYERHCARETWRQLNSPPWSDPRWGSSPLSYALEGEYPDTVVAVTMSYVHRRSPQTHRYPVWKGHSDHGLPDDGSMPTPELFGANVALWIFES